MLVNGTLLLTSSFLSLKILFLIGVFSTLSAFSIVSLLWYQKAKFLQKNYVERVTLKNILLSEEFPTETIANYNWRRYVSKRTAFSSIFRWKIVWIIDFEFLRLLKFEACVLKFERQGLFNSPK